MFLPLPDDFRSQLLGTGHWAFSFPLCLKPASHAFLPKGSLFVQYQKDSWMSDREPGYNERR
jgi:hypothetical protein